MPYRLSLLQEIHAVLDQAPRPDRKKMDELLNETGLSKLGELRASRRIVRNSHLEV